MSTRRVWTFHLVGGDPVSVFGRLPQATGKLEHDGTVSLWTMFLLDEEKQAVLRILEPLGIKVTATMQESGTAGYRTPKCPSCFWVDQTGEIPRCGLEVWTPETVVQGILEYAQAWDDAEKCPAELLLDEAGS